MRIQNNKHGIYRVKGGKEYKDLRLGGLECVRGGEKIIIRARERDKKKNRSVQADSQDHVSHYHELISRVPNLARN